MVTTGTWLHFEHEADMGIRGCGPTLADAFAATAQALTAVVCALETVSPTTPVKVECEAPNEELLLVDWLNALIFEMATRKMLFSRFEVMIDGKQLHATAWGETVSRQKHQPAVEIKGATYTELSVRQTETKSWCAQCVVDV